jgi:hypothetical protein
VKTSVERWTDYKSLVEKAGSLSRLFSTSSTPLIHPRFVEQLYCLTTGAINLARDDVSFDARLSSGAGVGIKTFGVNSFSSRKTEKIAEFTARASAGRYVGVDPDEVAFRVAVDRNRRVQADAVAFKVDLKTSIYHCLVRTSGACMVHEEKLQLINLDSIRLTNNPRGNGPIKFSDGEVDYTFHPSKNTLFKTFEIGSGVKSEPFEVLIKEGIFDELLGGSLPFGLDETHREIDPYVVLPLFSDRSGKVEPKSGINQWNAGGRERKFGESYIPVPSKIHQIAPGFFPAREEEFKLALPDGTLLKAKICQDGGKALMSNPNDLLMSWLFAQIDGDLEAASKRILEKRPYAYDDLLAVGRDSVRISKDKDGVYKMIPGGIGDYQVFVEEASSPSDI